LRRGGAAKQRLWLGPGRYPCCGARYNANPYADGNGDCNAYGYPDCNAHAECNTYTYNTDTLAYSYA
jgi:hypothetical protein